MFATRFECPSPKICYGDGASAATNHKAFSLLFQLREAVGRGLTEQVTIDPVQENSLAYGSLAGRYGDLEGVRKMDKDSGKEIGVSVGL